MILFITRKFPPSIGGMQQLSYDLVTAVDQEVPTEVIKWGGSQRWLPLFLPYALIRALWILTTREVDVVHIGDPALSPLGVILRLLGRSPVVVNAHGLDVAYPNRLYQAIVPACMRHLDLVICISEHTRQLCVKRGIKSQLTDVIPPGIKVDRFTILLNEDEKRYWADQWGLTSDSEHILLTVGRLVRRKGVAFLISQVLPKLARLRDDWAYLLVGDGPDRERIEAAIQDQRLEDKVHLLGQVPEKELRAAFAMATLFVMPNLPVTGDPEGFGLVTLEARAAGLPIVASSVDGIVDSFDSADDGVLVPPGDAEAFVHAIHELLEADLSREDRLRRREQISSKYGWSRIAQDYLAAFESVRRRRSKDAGKRQEDDG